MFRISFLVIIVNLVFAKDWMHYTRQNEVRDAIQTENGTLWAAFAWGLQERQAGKAENTYMPGSNNLAAADFVQLFALPGNDIIAISKNGILLRKNKNSGNFEIISTSFVEGKRNLLQGLGKRAGNILILPFEGTLSFFDYEKNRSVITLTQIGANSLESIKRIAVKDDSIWLDLGTVVWKRKIDWAKIHDDYFLANPNSWDRADNMPFAETTKPNYIPSTSNFPFERVKAISAGAGGDVLAWGNDFDLISRMQNGQWTEPFRANQNPSNYGDDQKNYLTKSIAMLPSGAFAIGMWGPGLMEYNSSNFPTSWRHSTNSGNKCPTAYSDMADGWTIVQGVVPAPDFSGYIFSYLSESRYGFGFTNGSEAACFKPTEASSPFAFSIIASQSEIGEWEIYVAWASGLRSKDGGIDFYITQENDFSPLLQKKWPLSFGLPIDFAFDSKGILWAASSSKIFYLDKNEDEWKEPDYIRGFEGSTILALEADAQNGLWVGTLGDGAYSFSQINNLPDSLSAKRFRIRDGLLNETVYDIAIDTIKGKVYFAHDLGLSIYSTALVRSASGYMQDGSPKTIAYPNPFRPALHNAVRIDYIGESSSVYIFDSSGKRVRFFKGNDVRGGTVVWDGTNESGKLVAPGLYHYIAATGKKTVKGKIIVER